MKTFTIRQALEAVGGRYVGSEAALKDEIRFVTSDSRTAGPGALFVAFKGERADGHDFMAACREKGAVCCLSEREPDPRETPAIVVDSTLRAIGALAAWHRSRFQIPVVGVTGSVGKTTTKEMIAAVLSQKYNTHRTDKNLNNELGVPWTLLRLGDEHEASVVEMGISGFGEMRRLTQMVRPTVAVMTVIGDAHLEFLGDRAGVLRAKGEIFEGMNADGLAVLNGDDALLKDYDPGLRRLTYGLSEGCDFRAEDVTREEAGGIRCRICHHGHSFEALIPAFGLPAVSAALAAVAVGWHLGMSDEAIARGLMRYQTVGDRARVIRTGRLTLVSDCYNANPNSMQAAFESLKLMEGRRVCILGDMLELGPASPAMHRDVGLKAAEAGAELVLTSGPLAVEIDQGAREGGAKAQWFADKQALIQALPSLLQEGDTVLVKASHGMAFEEIVKVLEHMEPAGGQGR